MWENKIQLFFFTVAISKFLPKILLEFIYTFSLLEKHVIFIQKFCEKNVGIYTFSMLKKHVLKYICMPQKMFYNVYL